MARQKLSKGETFEKVARISIRIAGLYNDVILQDTDMDEEAVKHLAESIEALSEGSIQFAKARQKDEQARRDEAGD